MSRSNAAAINRRVNKPIVPPPPTSSNPSSIEYSPIINNNNPGTSHQLNGLTFKEVVANLDKRIHALETNVHSNITLTEQYEPLEQDEIVKLDEVVIEFNNRFELIVEEIGNMKDIIIKLQSFTMDVNKQLLNERILSRDDKNDLIAMDTSETISMPTSIVLDAQLDALLDAPLDAPSTIESNETPIDVPTQTFKHKPLHIHQPSKLKNHITSTISKHIEN